MTPFVSRPVVMLVAAAVLVGCGAPLEGPADVSTDRVLARESAVTSDATTATDALDTDGDPEPDWDGSVPEDAAEPLDATAATDAAAMDSGAVAMDARADVTPPRDASTARPVTRTVNYRMATYTMRNNWVHDCSRGYGFTARGAEHIPNDCDRAYRPDGTLRGTATFTFDALIPGSYDVIVAGRHTVNRDPAGAHFVVNGERFMVNQRVGDGIVPTTLARRTLMGTVRVVLDSSAGGGSDSIQYVTLRPAP
ncbi:MAG: hypothetical protein Q8Q09_18550 [Deltaproteobacteria bacterium]|nr:hypothetical protein [Deltaproteobacteria bacterium]